MDHTDIDLYNYTWKNNTNNLKEKDYYRDDYNGKIFT
jgi:hypothetical protein